MVDFNSPYYPLEKTAGGYNTMQGAGKIPMQIVKYLLDMPDEHGYIPVDDNSRPRVRLAKYLWHDVENPLGEALPTPEQKLSMLYDGTNPAPNSDEGKAKHPKGFRIFPLLTFQRSEIEAKTAIKVYLGRVIPNSAYSQSIGLIFDVFCSPSIETTMRTDEYSKAYAMECALIEALHGVNMAGIGVIEFSRYAHGDNGSRYLYNEFGENIGRRLQMSITWMESGGAPINDACQINA